MSTTLGIWLGVAIAVAALVAAVVQRERSRSRRRRDDPLHRARLEVDAEVESHDIDDMLDAIDRYRGRRGSRTVGEELADELERGTWDT